MGEQLRACLKNKRNVDIDSAINGVCLPMRKKAKSDALLHSGGEGKLHGQRLESLLKLCEDNNLSREEFIKKIRAIAKGYTKGEIILP